MTNQAVKIHGATQQRELSGGGKRKKKKKKKKKKGRKEERKNNTAATTTTDAPNVPPEDCAKSLACQLKWAGSVMATAGTRRT